MKKLTKAEKLLLWDRLEENMELVEKISHDLQNTASQKSDEKSNQKEATLRTMPGKALTKKMIELHLKQQQLKANMIHNKLAYMRLSQSKEEKALELAKKNLMRITSIRRNSLRERDTLNKLRETFIFQHEAFNQSRARQVKSSRKNRQEALEKWKGTVLENAKEVRVEKGKYHTISVEQRQIERDINSQKADRVRKSLQKSRIAIEQSYLSRIENTRKKHRRDLQSRYRHLNEQKRDNEKLYGVLKAETERLAEWQTRKKREVEEFKSMWIRSKQNPETDISRSNLSFA